uniref:40S ribosomal protein S27 n=1 Tax=Nannospalax galili TaxID=1026970 RepID=A0A8C6RAY6_NANGA
MPLTKDLLHHFPEEKRKYKKKRLVQSPNSYFMDVKCPGCYKITTYRRKSTLTEGWSFRRKQH